MNFDFGFSGCSLSGYPNVTLRKHALPLQTVWNEPFPMHTWAWQWAVRMLGGRVLDRWHWESPDGTTWEAGDLERFASELMRNQFYDSVDDQQNDNTTRNIWFSYFGTAKSHSHANGTVATLANYLAHEYRDNGFSATPGYFDQQIRDTNGLARDIYKTAYDYMKFALDSVPNALEQMALVQAETTAQNQAETNIIIWGKNEVPNWKFWQSVIETVETIADFLQFDPEIALHGSPRARLQELDRAKGRLALAPMSRWESHETFTEDPDWIKAEIEQQKKAEETVPRIDSATDTILIPSAVPQKSEYKAPPTKLVPVGLTKEKILEYLPFVGVGVGIFRIFLR